MPKSRIRVQISNIKCNDTEDFIGSDEVYYLHTLNCAESTGRKNVEDPIPDNCAISSSMVINDGQVKRFPVNPVDENILFEGECDSELSIVGSVYFIDNDLGKLPRRLDIEKFNKNLLVPIGFFGSLIWLLITTGSIVVGQGTFIEEIGGIGLLIIFIVPVIILGFFVLLGLATQGVVKLIGRIDQDDYLGGFYLDIPVNGPKGMRLVGSFPLRGSSGIAKEGANRFSGTLGNVDYRVRISVVRF